MHVTSPHVIMLEEKDASGRALWQLHDDFCYRLMHVAGDSVVFTIPAGYVSNLGSVPKVLYFLVRPAELHKHAIVHDYLCKEYFGRGPRPNTDCPRWIADAILYDGCQRRGLPKWKCTAILLGVRMYAHWRRLIPWSS